MWKPGQSGNPTGHSGEFGTAIKRAQRAAPKAVRRLIELMDSEDERVAAVACNSILDRAYAESERWYRRAEALEPGCLEFRVKRQLVGKRAAAHSAHATQV